MKAMILAAGLGTRMRPLTDNCPKPLLKVAGKPLIVHHIEKLVAAGITDIVINHAYLGHMIEDYLKDGNQFNCRIQYSAEGEPLETAGGIIKALPLLKNDDDDFFLLVNGDVWLEEDFQQVTAQVAELKSRELLGHLWLVNNPEHHPEGDFALHAPDNFTHGLVTEKDGTTPAFTFAGVSLLSTQLFESLALKKLKLAPILKQAMASQKMSGQHFTGHWVDVGTPERLQELDQLITAG